MCQALLDPEGPEMSSAQYLPLDISPFPLGNQSVSRLLRVDTLHRDGGNDWGSGSQTC